MSFRILSARIEHARYERDFGQVEAQVSFLVKDPQRHVPHRIAIRTCEIPQGQKPLRERLIESARAILELRQPVATRVPLRQAA